MPELLTLRPSPSGQLSIAATTVSILYLVNGIPPALASPSTVGERFPPLVALVFVTAIGRHLASWPC